MTQLHNNDTFKLLRSSTKLLKRLSDNVNRFIDYFNNYKVHVVDPIVAQYLKLGMNDIDEFSSNYAFSHHFGKPYDSPESREAMYLEVKEYLKALRVKGEIG